MDYTITINPENWLVFLTLKPYTFSFRKTMEKELKKVKVGDRLVVYLAQEMAWVGVFEVAKEPYHSQISLYPSESQFKVRIEVNPIVLLPNTKYVPIKKPELWNNLIQFRNVNYNKSGWIYSAKLARSLSRMEKRDTDKIIEFLTKVDII